MKQILIKSASLLVLVAFASLLAFGQANTTGSLAGTITDPSGGTVPNASVTVRNEAGVEITTQTANNGTFNVPALAAGSYTATVTAQGFKQAIVEDIVVQVGTPSSINVALEVGAVTETVTVQGAGGELLQTQTATVGTTITGRQITEIPFSSRDALDLVLLLPGTNTPGRPRTSTINGLPKGTINITIDGINAQDNTLRSSDGFFTYIRPRLDAIDEVTVSTATPGAESSGDGAVQIRFVTRPGTNDLDGSLFWYHRNPVLNANYFFNNLAGLPRDRILLNQYGGRVGGPVSIPGLYNGRNRSFFFVNYEEFRLPEQTSRQRTILSSQAQQGIISYNTTGGTRTVNLLQLAAAAGQTSTIDPVVGNVLSAIRSSTSQGSVSPLDSNREIFRFTNTGGQNRYFTAVRLDHNITRNHHIENIWNYQAFRNSVDFLNSSDPIFPGFVSGVGGQNSNRFSNSTALRSTLSNNVVNEARFGLQGGTSLFRSELSPTAYSELGGYALVIGGSTTAPYITNPYATNSSSRRNSPLYQFTDTLTYVRGPHTMTFGGAFSHYSSYTESLNQVVPTITLALNTSDPAASTLFSSSSRAANFPGISDADFTQAQSIYATLTGRVTSIAGSAYRDENTGGYTYLGSSVERYRQREFGLFAQDSWRVRPNLTLNYGLRYEVQYPFVSLNNTATFAPYADVFGVSGEGNLFAPGTLTGRVPQFTQLEPGQRPYNTDYDNFAPSVGIAWSPNWRSGILNRLFGNSGRSVIRAGYSVAYVREGINVASSIVGATANPGGAITASRSIALGNLTAGTLLRNVGGNIAAPFPSEPTFPLTGAVTNSVNAFEPDLETGYVQSFTFGVQRELTRDMVLEVRYVGNRGVQLWRQVNLNETNVVENGFYDEFLRAQANLLANNAAGGTRAGSFAFFGAGSGTQPLPTILRFFRASVTDAQVGSAASYTSTNFRNASFLTPLSPGNSNPQAFANVIINNPATFNPNAASNNLAPNFFIVNPNHAIGGAFVITNQGRSYYDALTVELRRRLSQGLLVQANYSFGKSITNAFASSSVVFSQPNTLREGDLDRTVSPFDIRHAFKANFIYELPFGSGHRFFSDAGGVLDRIIGGFEFHGAVRVQSGSPVNFGNVQLVGVTREELQSAISIRPDSTGSSTVFYLPDDIILNTRRAHNVTSGGVYTLGAPEGRYIAPAGSGGCVPRFTGDCGNARLVLYGPMFQRYDLSIIKRIPFTERVGLEFRAEFLNAFNNINFLLGNAGNDVNSITNFSSSAFGQTSNAYRDVSTTNDSGGRIIQFVMRLNF